MRKCAIMVAAAVMSTAGCANGPTATPEDIEQEFVFQVENVNFAWGLFWVGIVVDREGRILRFDHSHAPWEPASPESFTEAELREKYDHEQSVVGRVDLAELGERFGSIAAVREEFSSPNLACADAGGLGYSAFRYDPAAARYHAVTLRVEGDVPRQNTSPAGRQLSTWLRGLLLDLDVPGVQPFPDDSCVP